MSLLQEALLSVFLTAIVIVYFYAVLRIVASRSEEESEDSLEPEDSPSPEQLQQLKQILNLEKGSVTFKKGSVYHIIYQNKKHVWSHVGSWVELRQQLET